jgi:hypothetical protein
MYSGGRRQDATRLDTCRLQLIYLNNLRVVVIYLDTHCGEEICLDTLHLNGKCPGTRRPAAKHRGTPRPDRRHMPCHSRFGQGATLCYSSRGRLKRCPSSSSMHMHGHVELGGACQRTCVVQN